MATSTEKLRPSEVIERYGQCLELVPLDRRFHDISVGLYVKDGVCTIWTFSRKEGVEDRIQEIRDQMIALGGMEAGAHVVGSNCGNGIDNMVDIARLMRAETDGFLLIHSNAGIPAMRSGEIIYPETPDYMAERFRQLADLGVNIIGGCCGTGPEHIKALAATVRRQGGHHGDQH